MMDKPCERLRMARERYYESARSAAVAKGWPTSTYASHENGDRNFREKDARKYSAAFGVPWEWLLTSANPPAWVETLRKKSLLEQAKTAHRLLPITDYSTLLKVKRAKNIALIASNEYVSIPIDDDQGELLVAVQIEPEDKSMSPDLEHPDFMIWDLEAKPQAGDIVLGYFNSCFYFRRYVRRLKEGKLLTRLEALNDVFESPEFEDGEGEIIAVADGQYKRFRRKNSPTQKT